MRIVVAGSSGLIGSALVDSLRSGGHSVARLVRREPYNDDEFSWDPESFGVPPDSIAGADAVVNLGGVSVGGWRWTGSFKQELRDSRITPTEVLAEAVAMAGVPVLLNASATGFYGNTGDHIATEADHAGDGFLAELVTEWEAAATEATKGYDTRVAFLRTAPVLSSRGGILGKLRLPFQLGLGAQFGDGRQYFSWISLADEVRAIEYLLTNDIAGPVNLAAPEPVRFKEFARQFAHSLHRPALLRIPGAAATIVGGEMAREMILYSQRVVPAVLSDHGFTFEHPTLTTALEYARG
ncbi:TIGR01777 family protein [Gordonia sp. TBRC 11910]|uniref:TIGR01777 family protein n=1 Tax=Gordonia asplenii TaxID=2725283 RepID=A0A848KYE1_9ACTN|nr:TIGR01777 family oxidoreductase [Gordonia asplenii]NMO03379.1 TIGR01777 family protein [Gordonia asplenii]